MKEVSLNSVCTITMGQAPPGTSYNQKSLGLPLIAGAGDFGKLNPEPTKFTTKPTKISKPGDLILCIRATIGNRNLADQPYCLGRGVAGLRPKPNLLDASYLWHWLEIGKDQLIKQARGSTFKQISQDAIASCQILLPPLEEQRRIAAILDKADAVRRKRQSAIALTEELLRSAFLEIFGDPVTNPKGWKVESLGEIATFLGGGTPSRKQPKYYEGDICWASSKDMSVDILVDTEEHITKEAVDNSSTKLVNVGVLLIVVKSKILMRRLPVARTEVITCFNQDVKAITPHDLSITRYLHRHIKLGQATLLKQARGVNTEGLTLDHLRNYKVMTPPALQVKKFVELEKSLERSLSTSQKAAKESQNLFNSLLQKAFRGGL